MSAYCFADILKINDSDKFEAYRDRVFANVERHGGRYLAVGGQVNRVEGDWQPTFPVIIEFPSLQQALDWYNSDDYAELKALRLAAAETNAVFIEGI
ncbi:MAG: DUF1330 domain-containing protein [Halothece sp.]